MYRAMELDFDSVRFDRRRVFTLASAAAAVAVIGPGRFHAAAQGEPGLEVVSPAEGATVNANDIQVQLSVSNFTLDGAAFGRPDQAGVGEVLAFVDGTTIAQLTNFYSTDSFVIAGDGLAPGQHTLTFLLASSTHVPMMDTAQQITIDFQPPQAVPLPTANFTGDPALTLVSPQDGTTVASSFEVQVQPVNLIASSALEGKTNVAGYGHYHVFVDTPMDESAPGHASLAGLVLMPGTNGFTLDLSAWGPGEHTIWIEPVQNDHTRYQPFGHVEFTAIVSETATPVAVASAVASPATAAIVKMTDQLQFEPPAVTVAVGETVTWINESAMAHTATDDPAKNPVAQTYPEYAQLPDGAAPWDSGLLQEGQSFSYTFTVPGTYDYFCIPHVLSGMRGTITVQG